MGPWGVFDGWNQLPFLPDRFTPPTDKGEGPRSDYLKKRCWVEMDSIVERLHQLRQDKDLVGVKLDKVFVSTNESKEWVEELEKKLVATGRWDEGSVKSTFDLDLSWEEGGVDNAIGEFPSLAKFRFCSPLSFFSLARGHGFFFLSFCSERLTHLLHCGS